MSLLARITGTSKVSAETSNEPSLLAWMTGTSHVLADRESHGPHAHIGLLHFPSPAKMNTLPVASPRCAPSESLNDTSTNDNIKLKLDDLPQNCLTMISAHVLHTWTRAVNLSVVCKTFTAAYTLAHQDDLRDGRPPAGWAGACIHLDALLPEFTQIENTVGQHLLHLQKTLPTEALNSLDAKTRASCEAVSINDCLTDIAVDIYLAKHFPNALSLTSPVDVAFVPSIMTGFVSDEHPWYKSDRATVLWRNCVDRAADSEALHTIRCILGTRLLFFPIMRAHHWVFLVREHSIGGGGQNRWVVLNSARNYSTVDIEATKLEIEQWLRNTYERLIFADEHLNMRRPIFESVRDILYLHCVQQNDGTSCGAYILAFARGIVAGAKLTSQLTIAKWRKHIALTVFFKAT